MWDTKSCFTAQTSAWCGRASISGTGFLSKVGTITSGSTGGFRQTDPSLRKWQSSYHLGPEGPTLSCPPSPGAELRAARGPAIFRQAEVGQWLQDAQERFDTQLGQLMARNSQLGHKITTGQLLDMKHKQLSDVTSSLGQEKGAPELSPFEKRQQLRELRERVLQLEEDLLQMRSDVDVESSDQPNGRTPGSHGRTLPMSQDNFNRQEGQNINTSCQLREALRDAEARAKKQEEERNQALQKLKTSTETQRALLSQIEEMKQRFNYTRQNQCELQEQLSEANNKISQACLEKAILSTRVLKLEDDIKGLKDELTGPDRDHPIQGNAHKDMGAQDLAMKREQRGSDGGFRESHSNNQEQQSKALREVLKEKMTRELEMIEQKLNTSQSPPQEITAARVISSKQITDLEAQCSQLISENEEQRKMNEGQHEELSAVKEKEVGNIDNRSAEAQTGASSLQDWTPMCKDMKSAVDRRSWKWGSDLMPVFEEDEENSDWPGGEEGKPAKETHAGENVYNQNQQIPTMSAEINRLEAKNANLLQATLRCEQPIQDCLLIAEEEESSTAAEPNLYDCGHDADQQQMKALSFYPDGIFLAELVDICSPDENEEMGDDK